MRYQVPNHMKRTLGVTDHRGRPLELADPPERIVSLVPSDTYTLMRLGAGARLVGRTRYCVEPAGELEGVPEVGGTKDADVDAILALRPGVVIANQEENTPKVVHALERAGVPVLLSFPKRVGEGLAQVGRLARLLGPLAPEARELLAWAYRKHVEAEAQRASRTPVRCFVAIWKDPWMTVHAETFVSDVLDLVGAKNVFAERVRRYPLSADVGDGAPLPAAGLEGRDVRYPRISLEELVAHAPELVLLPDEPYAFGPAEVAELTALDLPAAKSGRIVCCSGRPLMWHGLYAIEKLDELAAIVAVG
jgi:ABC-type Fe3+-hydroxamate transport system substrate-binding protein